MADRLDAEGLDDGKAIAQRRVSLPSFFSLAAVLFKV